MAKIWSEAHEQIQLIQWLESNNYKFTAVPNDTFTKSWAIKNKNKAMWVRPWMSDLIIILKRGNVLFLELKKAPWVKWWANGSVTSEYQLEWQKSINKCVWVQYEIVQGFELSKELILTLESW